MGSQTPNKSFFLPDYRERYGNKKNSDWQDLDAILANLPNDGTHGDAAHGPDYAEVSQLITNAEVRAAVEGNSDVADLSGADGTAGQVATTDGNDVMWQDSGGVTQAYSKAASGSVTLSNGKGTEDTGVTTDNGIYDVAVNPGGADIAASIDGTGSTYMLHFEENTSQIGNPTVSYQLLRSNL